MLKLTDKKLSIYKAIMYNKTMLEVKLLGQGCIDTLACEGCGFISEDSMCLCAGFKCLNCGYDNTFRIKIDNIINKRDND